MGTRHISVQNIAFKYGLFTASACILYFITMRSTGYIQNTNLRFFNYFFLAAGLWFTFYKASHLVHKHRISYLPGIILGFLVTFITGILYALFIFIYSRFIDMNFIPLVTDGLPYSGGSLNAYIIGVCIFFESMVVGGFLAFMLMQYFKRNLSPDKENMDIAEEKKY